MVQLLPYYGWAPEGGLLQPFFGAGRVADLLGRTAPFIAPNIVQITIEDGSVSKAPAVSADGAIVYDAGEIVPDGRFGGAGTLDGVAGNFTGARNTAVDQLFKAWATTTAPALADNVAGTLDDPSRWEVVADGSPVTPEIYRQTVPLDHFATGKNEFGGRRRHIVTLELPAPASDVRITAPNGQAYRASDAARSPAIHVCHEGYATGGSKLAYVGAWLGHDSAGQPATTNAALSAATAWELVRVSDGQSVASGTLSLVKAGSEAHDDGINYTGCDIYAADFGSYDTPGEYRVDVVGMGQSYPFVIAADPYAEALRLAARFYYMQRSGMPLVQPYAENDVAGDPVTRPRNGHPDDGLTVYQTNVLQGRYSEGFGAESVFNVIAAGVKAATLRAADDFLNAANWNNPAPTNWTLAATLAITGTGFRSWGLLLSEPMEVGQNYEVRVEVDSLTSAGAGLVLQPSGDGVGQSYTLTTGTNVITVAADRGYISLLFKSYSSTNAVISQITVTGEPQTNPDAWGGWHDAADWDRRIQHMEPIYLMAEMIERLPATRTLDMNIPESGRTFADAAVLAKKDATDTGDGVTVLPDLIHEALWGISLWRRTQGDTGGIIGGVEYSSDAVEGSVSWNPAQNAYAYAEEEWAAFWFVRAAAKLGHVIKTVCGDATLGDALISEAAAAWAWAEATLDTGIDAFNAFDHPQEISEIRISAAATLYRANGDADAKAVWESYNPFSADATTGLPRAGETLNTDKIIQRHVALDYVNAGDEGRAVNATIVAAIEATFGNWVQNYGPNNEVGNDFGLHNLGTYPWGSGWKRYGPGANWRPRLDAMQGFRAGVLADSTGEMAIEGAWFALGCNPSNVSLVQGLGHTAFAQPLTKDLPPYPGIASFGPASGSLRPFEVEKIGDSIYPAQSAWPKYAAIYESQYAIICSEYAMYGNPAEWLFSLGIIRQHLAALQV